MSFKNILKRALVDGQPVDVPENSTAGDMLQLVGQDPNNKSLVQLGPNGTSRMLRTTDRINLNNGNEFDLQMRGYGG